MTGIDTHGLTAMCQSLPEAGHAAHHERPFAHARLLQDGVKLGKCVLQYVLRTDVDFGDHKKDGDFEGQSHP